MQTTTSTEQGTNAANDSNNTHFQSGTSNTGHSDTTNEENVSTSSLSEENISRINLKDFKEMAASKINSSANTTWLFDDINCYRVTIQKTLDGNLKTYPINGALFTLNMNSGQLFVKVIHTSRWEGLKRLAQTSKVVAAEELAALIQAIPDALHPQNLLTTRSGVLPMIKEHLKEWPEIQLSACSFRLPLQALMRVEKFHDIVLKATESTMVFFIVYDDWLNDLSPAAAFRRLLIILQAILANTDAALNIINARKDSIASNHIWPTLSSHEWTQMETQLKKIMIDHYAAVHNIPVESITEEKIEELIYGEEW
jgi:pre-mRNA-processing factor 8